MIRVNLKRIQLSYYGGFVEAFKVINIKLDGSGQHIELHTGYLYDG